MYLEKINGPEDVKKIKIDELPVLAQEIRDALLVRASKHGGHFGPNFGMVEATIALHYVFESPKDKIVYDVSHQSYPHKMLTGRKEAYLSEQHYDDVSGYTNPNESEHDFFTVGHTSTSVSLAAGLAKARDLKGENGNVIAVIGDGSLSGGEALEGLDFAAELQSNFIIIVNDNDMSIAENHGGLYQNLALLRKTDGQAECNLFKAMGLDYVYVDRGNDVAALIKAFKEVKDSTKPVVVHINTLKGKGYAPAEKCKEQWHYSGPFDIETGKPLFDNVEEDYSSVTCEYLLEKMKNDSSVVAITSGTPTVMGFTEDKRKEAGSQFVDVGIAEETAVALASGIAVNGGKPFQDIPMLSNIPNLVYLAPATKEEYLAMLDWSMEQTSYPVAIKLPGGPMISDGSRVTKDFGRLNRYEVAQTGEKIAIIGLGTFFELAKEAAKLLKEEAKINATIINPYYITGLDETLLTKLKQNHDTVITIEDGILDGGFGEKIARFYGASNMKVMNYGLKKEFLDRYDVDAVLKENHLTAEQIVEDVLSIS